MLAKAWLFCLAILNLYDLVGTNALETHDLYEILGINSDATTSDIKKAYRRLSLAHHPDRQGSNITKEKADSAANKFRSINGAYEVLSDPEKRKYYDAYGSQYESMLEYFEEIIYTYNILELYAFNKDIQIFFDKNVEQVLAKSKYKWIVTFYHASCGSCQRAVTLFTRMASLAAETDDIRVGVMNCAVNMSLCTGEFEIDTLGQIYVFSPNQDGHGLWDYDVYNGPLIPNEVINFASTIPISEVVKFDGNSQIMDTIMRYSDPSKSILSPITGIWVVDYYKPSCPPCRQLKKDLRTLSTEFTNVLKIGIVDCSVNPCGVPYFPYIRAFVRRENSEEYEAFDIDYNADSHPGALAIRIVGFVMKMVIGFQLDSSRSTDHVSSWRGASDEL